MHYVVLDATSKKVEECENWTEENDNRNARDLRF